MEIKEQMTLQEIADIVKYSTVTVRVKIENKEYFSNVIQKKIKGRRYYFNITDKNIEDLRTLGNARRKKCSKNITSEMQMQKTK